jgi:hypothetical protein
MHWAKAFTFIIRDYLAAPTTRWFQVSAAVLAIVPTQRGRWHRRRKLHLAKYSGVRRPEQVRWNRIAWTHGPLTVI